MGNTQKNEKVERAKINEFKEDLELKFNEAVTDMDKERCDQIRLTFIKKLAVLILDAEQGINPNFVNFCRDLLKAEIEDNENLEKSKETNSKKYTRATTTNFKSDAFLIEKIKKEGEFEAEHASKKKEDTTFKQSKTYFSQHMNTIRVFSSVGSNSLKATSSIANVLSKTARLATNFSLIGITLTYLSAGIFEDDGTKMKKMTEKMGNVLRKEIDYKIYQQSMDDLEAHISTIIKLFDKLEKHVNEGDNHENMRENFEKTQIILSLLEICDVIYEKILQCRVYYNYSILFLQFFYFFVRIHILLLKLAINEFSILTYKDFLKVYIQNYKTVFEDYFNKAKRFRVESFIKKEQQSSFNMFTKVLANQYKVYDHLIDNFNSEAILSTERSYTFNESVSGNVFANLSTLYHELDRLKPSFYDIDQILPILQKEISLLLDERLDCILQSFNLFLERIEKSEIINQN